MIDPVSLAAGAGIAVAALGGGKRKRNRSMVRKLSPPGTSPDKLVMPDNAMQTKVDIIRYSATHHEVIAQASLDNIVSSIAESQSVSWVHVSGLRDIAFIEALGKQFGFHRLLVEDILSVGHRPKMERYDGLLFVILRLAPHKPGDDLDQLSMVQFGNCVITFDERHGDCFDLVRSRLAAGGQLRSLRAIHLLMALMDAAVDAYFPLLEAEGAMLDRLEDRVLEPRAPSVFAETTEVKRRLLSYRRALWPTRELVGAMLRESEGHVPDDSKPYLRDIHDHAMELADLVELFRETATGLSELHLAMASARLNDVMRFLTIISTLFMPLSFIAGVYGMNFDNMPELHWHWGYFAVMGLMAVIGMGFLFFFWRNGLLGAPGDDPALKTRRGRGQ